jgi:hypothetical protein
MNVFIVFVEIIGYFWKIKREKIKYSAMQKRVKREESLR